MNKSKFFNRYFDGGLESWLRVILVHQGIRDNEMLSINGVSAFADKFIARAILDARKIGAHWVWNEDSIRKDEEEAYFSLPSVDLQGYLEFSGHDNLQLNLKTKHKIELEGCIWDTEFSAWYPAFDSKENAISAINKIDSIFDKRYLPQLEAFIE